MYSFVARRRPSPPHPLYWGSQSLPHAPMVFAMVSHPPHPIAHSVRWLAGYGALLAITFSLLLSAGGPTQGDTAERPPVDRRGTPAVPSRASIDELVSDLRLQIQLAFRRDVEERALRLRETQEAIGLWKQSPRSAADEEVFRNWLRRAIRHSMPGARGGLFDVI